MYFTPKIFWLAPKTNFLGLYFLVIVEDALRGLCDSFNPRQVAGYSVLFSFLDSRSLEMFIKLNFSASYINLAFQKLGEKFVVLLSSNKHGQTWNLSLNCSMIFLCQLQNRVYHTNHVHSGLGDSFS